MPDRTIKVRVTAGAKTEQVTELAPGIFAVRVAVPPEKGKANNRVAALLAQHFGIGISRVFLIKGATSREKVFLIEQ